MSIESEILRIQHNVANTYAKVAEKGGTVPTQPNSANLAAAVASIPAGMVDGVTSINDETGAITLAAGDNVSITKTGKTITISATGGGGAALQSLAITTPPDKTRYKAGDTFDPTGMETYAAFSDDSGIYVDKPSLTFTPSGELTADDTAVEVAFSFGGKTVTAEQPVTVAQNFVWWSPHMTSDTAPAPYAASASSVFSSDYAAWKAFDGTPNTDVGTDGGKWLTSAANTNSWIQFDFGSPSYVFGIKINPGHSGNGTVAGDSIYILGSDDGITWKTIMDPTGISWNGVGQYNEFVFDEATKQRFIRVGQENTSVNPYGWLSFGDIQFYKAVS